MSFDLLVLECNGYFVRKYDDKREGLNVCWRGERRDILFYGYFFKLVCMCTSCGPIVFCIFFAQF